MREVINDMLDELQIQDIEELIDLYENDEYEEFCDDYDEDSLIFYYKELERVRYKEFLEDESYAELDFKDLDY